MMLDFYTRLRRRRLLTGLVTIGLVPKLPIRTHKKPISCEKRRLSIWISPRDLTQLVRIGLEHPDIRYEIVYGVSNNQRSWYAV
jgi:hypothetical protein